MIDTAMHHVQEIIMFVVCSRGLKHNIYFRPSGLTLVVNNIVSNFKCVQLHSATCESMRMMEIYH